ncbi:MAG: class I SAM-dependent methyltransferase [Microthrixaceae bacterium]
MVEDPGRDVTLRDAWEERSPEWSRWARQPGLDSYWTFHRDRFFASVPTPGRLTLDLACGEGRVGRDLAERGHRVVATDSSAGMCRAAAGHRHARPVVVGDAGSLPLARASVDLVVAFMALHDFDDLAAPLAEAHRVLTADGRLVAALVHPLNSGGAFPSGPGGPVDEPFVLQEPYLSTRRYSNSVQRDGSCMEFHGIHRPLGATLGAAADAGFLLERLVEVGVPDTESRWSRFPLFLHLVLRPD